MTTSSLPAGVIGTAYPGATLQAAGGISPYTWAVTTGNLPAGLSLNTSTGAISGTPNGTFVGAGNFTVTVTDNESPTKKTASANLSISISAPALSVTTTSLAGGTIGNAYTNQTLQATGGIAPYTWTVTTGSLPAGLSLNASTGVISGTPSSIVARRQPAHHLVPYRVFHRSTALEQFVTAQPLLAIFRAPQTRSLDRHLLPVHHAVTGFFSPAVSAPRGMLLMPLPGQVPHFFFHHQAHQRQPGFAHEVAHSFLQQTDDLGHRKNHLKVGILFAGQLSEFLHRSLLVDLVSFLHSDSLLFLGRKTTLGHYDRG